MIREVHNITHGFPPGEDRVMLNLMCGHKVFMTRDECSALQEIAAVRRESAIHVNCTDCDRTLHNIRFAHVDPPLPSKTTSIMKRLERLDFVRIVSGPYAGEKGRIWELLSDNQYGVKLLTGLEKNQKGTFVAREDDLMSYAQIIGQAVTDAHDHYVKSVLRPIGTNPARFSDDEWKAAMGRAAIKAMEELP